MPVFDLPAVHHPWGQSSATAGVNDLVALQLDIIVVRRHGRKETELYKCL